MKSSKYIVGAVCLALGFLIAWSLIWLRQENGSVPPDDLEVAEGDEILNDNKTKDNKTKEDKEKNKQEPGLVLGYAVQAMDQAAGGSVSALSVSLAADSWLAIYEDKEGSLGSILGAGRFMAGDYPAGGKVELLRNTTPGANYYVLIHKDDGIEGFDKETDVSLADVSGRKVMSVFRTFGAGTGACVVSGCSAQICSETAEELAATTCEFKPEYVCYKSAACERQEDGKCGWTPTEGLQVCLSSSAVTN